VEAAGIEPASEKGAKAASTSLSGSFDFVARTTTGNLPRDQFD
jgi:hypothetical protein